MNEAGEIATRVRTRRTRDWMRVPKQKVFLITATELNELELLAVRGSIMPTDELCPDCGEPTMALMSLGHHCTGG